MDKPSELVCRCACVHGRIRQGAGRLLAHDTVIRSQTQTMLPLHMHTRTYARTHARTHAHTHARARTHLHTRAQASTHAPQACTHKCAHTAWHGMQAAIAASVPLGRDGARLVQNGPRIYAHKHTHAHAHARTHTRTHNFIQPPVMPAMIVCYTLGGMRTSACTCACAHACTHVHIHVDV